MEAQTTVTQCSLGVFDGKRLDCEDLGKVNALHVASADLTYAVIGDMHEVVPAINEEIRRRRG